MKDNPYIVRKEEMDKLNEEFPKKFYKELKEKGETNLEEERFINEWKVSDLIYHAENNQDDAIEIIRLAVEFLKDADKGSLSIPLPVYLGKYLGKAFEKALEVLDNSESENKGGVLGKALSDALHITSNNRRPAHRYDVSAYMLQYIESGKSINEAADEASIAFNISESTAKRCFREMSAFFKRQPNGEKIEE